MESLEHRNKTEYSRDLTEFYQRAAELANIPVRPNPKPSQRVPGYYKLLHGVENRRLTQVTNPGAALP